ncbi:MAG: sigma-70 family RNA polymerase sigma factor [Clostridium sp.]|nr:sigma-70 family RNA polymerase sigma factor [Clostridium sp.]MCM1444489.1 sigma-70 family RNA polymerase sigma factor [Candidatus Amulumruptor caecigallinarius]
MSLLNSQKLPHKLSKEELNSLFEKFKQDGDFKAREKIIKHNIRLVLKIVSNLIFKNPSLTNEKDDLESIGLIGLIKSVDTFDIEKNILFSSYASKCITNELFMSFRKYNKYINGISINEFINEEENITIEDVLEDKSEEFIFNIENKEEIKEMFTILDKLKDRDKEIMKLYFGLDNRKQLNHREIGKKLNISRSYVSRIISKNLKLMKDELENYDKQNNKTKGEFNTNNINYYENKCGKLHTVYDILPCIKNQTNVVIDLLKEESKNFIKETYGNDLELAITDKCFNENDKNYFYNVLIPEMEEVLKQVNSNNLNSENMYDEITDKDEDSSTQSNNISENSYAITQINEGGNSYMDFIKYLDKGDLDNAFITLNKYLNSIDKIKYEPLIRNLINISVIEKDDKFTKVLSIINEINSKDFIFDISEYIKDFYETLQEDRLDEANIYLNIIKNSNELGFSKILTGNLQHALYKSIGNIYEREEDDEMENVEDKVINEQVNKNEKETKQYKHKRLRTVYELLDCYDKELVNRRVISKLTEEEKILFDLRNGNDLDNPQPNPKFGKDEKVRFNDYLLQKMKRMIKVDNYKSRPIIKTDKLNAVEDKVNVEEPSENKVINEQANKNEKEIKQGKHKRLRTVYELLNCYDKELVNSRVISKLTEEEKTWFDLRNGNDLDNPKTDPKFGKKESAKFYANLLPKMRRLIKVDNYETSKDRTKIKTNDLNEIKINIEESCENEVINNQVQESIPINLKDSSKNKEVLNLEKEDYIKMLELIKSTSFKEMLNILTPKEALIICLKLGYIDDKYFSTESIANFLGIDESEVNEITKKVLLLYKEKINKFIDDAIVVMQKKLN